MKYKKAKALSVIGALAGGLIGDLKGNYLFAGLGGGIGAGIGYLLGLLLEKKKVFNSAIQIEKKMVRIAGWVGLFLSGLGVLAYFQTGDLTYLLGAIFFGLIGILPFFLI